ncbi:uncharacterized protein Bfra_002165 [Botrytis fragariae]|uniref:Subtilisin-like serine protease n=1 Tax=Botrytis fragariae TaxID=1964551 RepID=A0A8H6B2C5_9HELO|nr:uncharacterized protein Bfra_002165 [Botrytis fragariae]KAF5877797.1 hypothetical protein Bfra_002165 [Botrytis fragariae]
MQEPPFVKADQLNDELDIIASSAAPAISTMRLPGQPRIYISQHTKVDDFLKQEFLLKDLEEISPHLWMMSKHDSKSISPLHRQKVKGREIVITEDPRLHLVWYHDRIFIKPLPKYLLSHHFWEKYLCVNRHPSPEQITLQKAVLGYLRTYIYLIKYESDFRIAIDDKLRLIPPGITFLKFCDFIAHLETLLDADVAERYAYGEIRLTRLNLYSKIFLMKFSFHRICPQYSDYFASFYGPLLFVFATLSVVLGAMQVSLAIDFDATKQWKSFGQFCQWFSVICLSVVAILVLWLGLLFLYKFIKEWVYAIAEHQRRKDCSKDCSKV